MNATVKTVTRTASSKDAAARVRTFDWQRVSQDLDAQGSAVIEGILSPDECHALAGLYSKDDIFSQPGRDGTARFRPWGVQVF